MLSLRSLFFSSASALGAGSRRLGTPPVPTLRSLSLSTAEIAEGTASNTVIAGLLGSRPGSTFSITNTAGGRFGLAGTNIIAGATATNFEAATSHSITIRETNAAYPNSPRDTVIVIDVINVLEAPTLNALGLSASTFTTGSPSSGALTGATAGSTISATNLPTGLAIDGAARTWSWSGAGAASTPSITLTETLADSPNSPRQSNVGLSITAATLPLHLIIDGDSIMATEVSVTGPLVEAIGDLAIKVANYNNANGGHDRFDIRDGLPTPLGLMRADTLFIMGPIGANNGLSGTVAEHRATFFEIGDAILANPNLQKLVWVPTLPDKVATGASRVQRKVDLANIVRADLVARYGTALLVPDTTGFDPEVMKTDDTHPNRLRGQLYLAQRIEDVVRPIYQSQLASSYLAGTNKLSASDWDPNTWAGTGAGWTKTNSGTDGDGTPWVEWSINNASALSTLTLTRSVVENGVVGDVSDFLCELEFLTFETTPGDAKFLGVEALLGSGRTAGQSNGAGNFLPVPARRIYPRTVGTPLSAPTTSVNAQLRIKVDAGGSLTFRMRRPQVRLWFNAAAALSIQGLPPVRGQVGRAVNFAPAISGGTAPYSVSVNSPIGGLSVNPVTGVVTGVPSAVGNFTGRVLTVTDAVGATATLAWPSFEVVASGAPWNTTAPAVSPTPPRVAAPASTTNGVWDNSPATFEYRWVVDGNTDELASETSATTAVLPARIEQAFLASEVRASNVSGVGHWVRSAEQQIGAAVADTTAPTITSSAAVSVQENAVLAHTLQANEAVTWTIRSVGQNAASADAAQFELSGSTLRFASNGTKDFEAPGDANTNNTYVVVVRATDAAGNFTDQTFTATVTDVVEGDVTAPTITSAAAVSVAEGATLAHALTANEAVTWSVQTSTDSSHFEISGTTLRFTGDGVKDFEAPTDNGTNNTYVVVIRAVDASNNFADQTITVTVTDVVEAATPTWNPTVNFGGQLTYSNSNRTVANNAATNGARFARQQLTPGKTTGKWYARVTLTGSGASRGFGLGTNAIGGSSGGVNATSRWYWVATSAFTNSGTTPLGTNITLIDGDYEVAFDRDLNLVWFRQAGGLWNNNPSADPTAGAAGGGLSISGAGSSEIFVIVGHPNNTTSSSTFVPGTPPAGFTAL